MQAADVTQNRAQSVLEEIKLHLERRKEEIYNEIKSYPPPIPACDAQFNYLLELRNVATQELSQVNTLLHEPSADLDPLHSVESFLHSSVLLTKRVKLAIQKSLGNDWVTR